MSMSMSMSMITTATDRIINGFTDAYQKGKNSNNYKLVNIIAPEFDELRGVIEHMKLYLDFDEATGKTLDKLAKNVNQLRGRVNDIILRTLIRTKIASDMSDGTINTVMKVIGFIISDNEGQVRIEELYNDSGTPEPAAFRVVAPMENVVMSGITLNQFIQILNAIKAAGVRISADLKGTFIFGTEEEYGQFYDTGFADNDQTMGGTLGMLYDPSNEDPLPID